MRNCKEFIRMRMGLCFLLLISNASNWRKFVESFSCGIIVIITAFIVFGLACTDVFLYGRNFFIKMLLNTIEEQRVVLPMYI